jgi:hypothetical protein
MVMKTFNFGELRVKERELGEEYSKKMSFEDKLLLTGLVILMVGFISILIWGVPKELVM